VGRGIAIGAPFVVLVRWDGLGVEVAAGVRAAKFPSVGWDITVGVPILFLVGHQSRLESLPIKVVAQLYACGT
jgi:hypothetical protein